MSDQINRAAEVIERALSRHGEHGTYLDAARALDAAGLLAKYPHLEIEGDWLIEVVNYHTCGAGPGSGAGHEPGCGTIPVGRLATPAPDEALDDRYEQEHENAVLLDAEIEIRQQFKAEQGARD